MLTDDGDFLGERLIGAVEDVVSGGRWVGRTARISMLEQGNGNRCGCQRLEVHGDGGQAGLELHVLSDRLDGSGKSVERLGGAVGAFDPSAVAGTDRVFVFTPCRAFG
jgi:hypothetical protein